MVECVKSKPAEFPSQSYVLGWNSASNSEGGEGFVAEEVQERGASELTYHAHEGPRLVAL